MTQNEEVMDLDQQVCNLIYNKVQNKSKIVIRR